MTVDGVEYTFYEDDWNIAKEMSKEQCITFLEEFNRDILESVEMRWKVSRLYRGCFLAP